MEGIILIRLNNDYHRGAHPAILALLQQTNDESFGGYGEDRYCSQAADDIRKLTQAPDADIHFFPGATQANFVVCSAALRPIESVICADAGHINCHEAASVEHLGHKLLPLPSKDAKITAAQIQRCAEEYYDGGEPEYLTEPKLVYLSFPTELGTLYSRKELEDIQRVCAQYGMYLFIDGARMGYGLGAEENDVTLADLARLTDVFYLGGTKCGAMFGEAVVITNDRLKHRFKTYMKQNGAVMAKGWLMGLQFHALLEHGDYFAITRKADQQAMQLKAAFQRNHIPLAVDSPTNQQFVILTPEQENKLGARYIFEQQGRTENGDYIVRFCTSWATKEEELRQLIHDIDTLS